MQPYKLDQKIWRLLAEFLVIIGLTEAGVMMVLPVIAPGVSTNVETLLDVLMLSVFAAPLLLWRASRFGRVVWSAVDREDSLLTRSSGVRPLLLPAAVLVVGLVLTAFSALQVRRSSDELANARFDQLVVGVERTMVALFEQAVDGMRGTAGLYNASKTVERQEFLDFWEYRDIAKEFGGVRGMGFIQPVQRTDLADFVARERQDNAPFFTVKTTGTAPDMYVIKHLTTMATNPPALGLDVGPEPVRRAAMLESIETGRPTLTGVVSLVLEKGVIKPGFLYLMPIFRRGSHPADAQQRKANLLGFSFASIMLDDIMQSSLEHTLGQVRLELYDGNLPKADPAIFDSGKALATEPATSQHTQVHTRHRFAVSRSVQIGGRFFVLSASSTPAYEESLDNSKPALLGVGGALISLLMALSVWLMANGRALAEERARKLNADIGRLAKVAQLTTNSVIIANAKNEVEWVNDAYVRITGVSREASIGKRAGDLRRSSATDPDTLGRIRSALAQFQDIRTQGHYQTPDGSDYWLDQDFQLVYTAGGRYDGYVAVETDITSEKRATETLEVALMEMAALMNTINTHAIVSETDARGVITSVNKAFQEISGFSRSELVGGTHAMLNSGIHPPEFWSEMWGTISSGKPWRGQVSNSAKDGSLYWVDSLIAPFVDQSGKIVKYVSIRTDITAMKEYERSLQEAREDAEQATRSKGQFLANMSHEIRTPMNAILGMLALLQNTDLTMRQADYASKSQSAAKSLLALINDILDFSKVEAGKMTLDPQPFRMDRLLRDLSVVLSSNLGAKTIEVLFDVDPQLPQVLWGDSMRLQQVLINLGGNAVKFTSVGQVVIGLRGLPVPAGAPANSVYIEFSVKDSGIGIAPENQAHIFSGFSQAEASTTRRFGGTGLGLAISQRLVDVMGGKLELTSALGLGSTFSFALTLPVVQDVPKDLQVAPRIGLEPQRVLVIDDNAVARELMLQMTLSWGWQTDAVSSGEAAIALMQERARRGEPPYQVIYLDWHMPPGIDGWEAAKRIRRLDIKADGKDPVIIMVTGQGRETLAQRTHEEQSLLSGFLVKPITASMLQDAVIDAKAGHSHLRKVARSASKRRLNGMRLLVVEDNLINQQVAEELLNSEGAFVSLAANGQLGVDAVAAADPQFDAVLMDIQMPVMDGYVATREIRTRLGLTNLPIVAMTANAMPTDREECLAAGMSEHVGKPFDLAHLAGLLLRLTGFEPVTGTVDGEIDTHAGSAEVQSTPELDVQGALARMSGIKSLYVRSAREFSKSLTQVVDHYRSAVESSRWAQAAMQMHTLKGTAATLGANGLSKEAAALEKLCKAEPPSVQTALAPIAALAGAVRAAQLAIDNAVFLMDATTPSTEVPAKEAALAPVDVAAAQAALGQLADLLAQGDMAALEVHATARSALEGLAQEPLDRLEDAMQSLDFDGALAATKELLALLPQ